MNRSGPALALVAAGALFGCGAASYPAPTQRMVDAKSSAMSAEENVQADPRARLHVALAKEEIARADALMANGHNRRADFELVRAKGDADLAVALEKDRAAHDQAQEASARAEAVRKENPTPPQSPASPEGGAQ